MWEPTEKVKFQEAWLKDVDEWFPELDSKTYFVPNIHMNKLNYKLANDFKLEQGKFYVSEEIRTGERRQGEKDVLSVSDVIDDIEAQRLLHCMRALAERKLHQPPMFVLTQMKFENYLSKVQESCFPKPVDMDDKNHQRGDFDLLVIHRDYGLLVGELKGVGTITENGGRDSYLSEEGTLLTDSNMEVVRKRLEDKSLKQLDKEVKVLLHLTSDLKPCPPRIRQTLILPNLWRSQVRQVFDKYPELEQKVIKRLQPPKGVAPEWLCLCGNDVPRRETSYDITDDVLLKLEEWFEHVLTSHGRDETFEQYKVAVARFVGPASTISIFCVSAPRKRLDLHLQTEGQAVSWAGSCFAELVLHPTQVDHLCRADLPRAFLFGPPGTGKSVMLVLKAVQWLRMPQEVKVIVLCAHQAALAAAFMIEHQVRMMVGEKLSKRLYLLETDKTKVIKDLLNQVDDHGQLFVVADEAAWYRESHLCDELYDKVPKLHLWAAHCRKFQPPKCLELIALDQPLRFPPSIRREIENTNVFKKYSAPYAPSTVHSAPLPTDGPPVSYVYHVEGEGHTRELPGDCVQCGRLVAEELDKLRVGKPVSATASTPASTSASSKASTPDSSKDSTPASTPASSKDSTPASTSASSKASSPASSKATTKASRKASSPASSKATTKASRRATSPASATVSSKASTKASSKASTSASTTPSSRASITDSSAASPDPLRFSDVLLVTYLKDPNARDATAAGGIIEGLRISGVPISVVRSDDRRDLAAMATMSHQEDLMLAADFSAVGGLERKVVVVVDCPLYDDRFYSTSRSTSKLIWVTADEKKG